MKKMAKVLLCVMVLSTLAIGSQANAAPPAFAGWYNCTVSSAGSLGSFYFMFVTNNDAVWTGARTFLIDAANPATNTMLAALLTGYASGGQVSLYLPGGTAANSFVSGVVAGSL